MILPLTKLADQFMDRYLSECDYKYCSPDIEIYPDFKRDIENIISQLQKADSSDMYYNLITIDPNYFEAIKSIAEGILSQVVFNYLREKYHKLRINRLKTAKKIPIQITGEDVNKTFLDFGSVRPFFKIEPGQTLILENLTILYSGELGNMFEEEFGPSVILNNVVFKKKE